MQSYNKQKNKHAVIHNKLSNKHGKPSPTLRQCIVLNAREVHKTNKIVQDRRVHHRQKIKREMFVRNEKWKEVFIGAGGCDEQFHPSRPEIM